MICDDVGGWVTGHNAEPSWALGSPLGAFSKRPSLSLLTSCSHCCFGKVSATQVKTLVRLGCSCRVEGGAATAVSDDSPGWSLIPFFPAGLKVLGGSLPLLLVATVAVVDPNQGGWVGRVITSYISGRPDP